MNIFQKLCSHPFRCLHVEKDPGVKKNKEYPDLFEDVTIYLYCRGCNKKLPLEYSSMIGGVKQFLNLKD